MEDHHVNDHPETTYMERCPTCYGVSQSVWVFAVYISLSVCVHFPICQCLFLYLSVYSSSMSLYELHYYNGGMDKKILAIILMYTLLEPYINNS